jgi:hypothetical protein
LNGTRAGILKSLLGGQLRGLLG